MPHRVVMPSFGMYTVEGTLAIWLAASGATVAEGQPILEIETEKATQEVVAPAAGRLHHVAEAGAHVTEQELLGYILGDGEVAPTEPAAPEAPTPSIATPIARRLAGQYGLDLAGLTGSGPGGRIVEADVEAARQRRDEAGSPLSGMRKAIGDRLRRSLNEAVSCTLTREVEAERLVDARRGLNETLAQPVPLDAFFAKFLALELREHPELNVILQGGSLLQLEHTHIGIAVTVEAGLVVPVLRNPDIESLAALGDAVRDFAERARLGKLRADELEDGASTVSNLGAYGVDAFTPILNPPQSTILGVGRIVPRAVVRGTELVASQTLVLSLTFDHRVADGAAAASVLAGIDRRMNDESYLGSLA